MSYNLFLDDIREPSWVYKDPPFKQWVVARNYDEAVNIVEKYGFPNLVSLDHDLGDSGTKSGMDFAKYLVARDLDYHDMPENFEYLIHSSNPAGAANIRGLLDSYAKYKKGSG